MIKEIYKLNLYVDGKMYEQLPLEVFNILDLKTNDYMEQPLKEAKYCVVDSPLIDENDTYKKVIDTRFVDMCATDTEGDLTEYGFIKDGMTIGMNGVYIIWRKIGWFKLIYINGHWESVSTLDQCIYLVEEYNKELATKILPVHTDDEYYEL